MSGQHTYQQPESYTVRVTVWDTLSNTTGTFTVTVTVARPAAHPSVTASVVSDGQGRSSVAVAGTGFTPGERVTVRLGTGPAAFATVTVSSSRAVQATVEVPRGTRPGRYAVTATGTS
ncbi:hypothetical protein OG519_26535 [Streptomyces sp. NBC_01190]|nr:hypothetical protein OG519_26535 [Streptomyces sp. NBC_01190]